MPVGAPTDTLADSRTSARVFTEGVPLVVEDVRRRPAAERDAVLADPGFGRHFTDSMVLARYRAGEGWYDARLTSYAPLQVDPATAARKACSGTGGIASRLAPRAKRAALASGRNVATLPSGWA